jgi:4-amino-4-deoxy-L-arabinose transferase-like glycosyltransferase
MTLLKTYTSSNKLYLALFGLCGLAYLAGLLFPVQGVDANQYFAMSQEMIKTGNYLEIYHRGGDYLDKPPLLFWFTGAFFKLFGVGEWQYRLPSFLFTLLAVYSTYRLGKLLYNENTGKLAALILFSCQAFFLFNHDVRTDTMLTGSIIFAVWQLISYLQSNSWKHLILGFAGIGLGMLAKGPMGIVLPAMALGTHVLLKGEWKHLFKWQWIVGLLVTGLILSPMLWGLYHQFDLHPEKTVNGRTGVSGIYFFFWEQSFGRITGENVWKDDSTPFFFTHTYLWSYLPWVLAGIAALAYSMRTLLKKSLRQNREYYTLGGTLLPFLALSTSNFKLPHYIFIIYPLLSILVADFLLRYKENKHLLLWGKGFVGLLIACVGGLLVVMLTVVFPSTSPALWALALMAVVFPVFMFFTRSEWLTKLVSAVVCLFALANLFLNIHFYPKLAPYDAGYSAGLIIAEQGGTETVHALYENSFAIEVSGRCSFKFHSSPATLATYAGKNTFVYTSPYGYEQMKEAGIQILEAYPLDHYIITLLKVEFLNAKTRPQILDTMYLVKI